jgi:hypothetical protein
MRYVDMNVIGMMNGDCAAIQYNFSGHVVFQNKSADTETQE